MSEIYSDCKISDSSGVRAEVYIVDAEDGESDEAEFGDVGEDNIGDDSILGLLFDMCRTGLIEYRPAKDRLRAESERLRRRSTHDTRDGFLSKSMDCFLCADGQAELL